MNLYSFPDSDQSPSTYKLGPADFSRVNSMQHRCGGPTPCRQVALSVLYAVLRFSAMALISQRPHFSHVETAENAIPSVRRTNMLKSMTSEESSYFKLPKYGTPTGAAVESSIGLLDIERQGGSGNSETVGTLGMLACFCSRNDLGEFFSK